MAPIKRAATPPPASAGVNFGDDSFYMGGNFNLPEGNYALLFDIRMHAFTKANGTKGEEYLGVMVHAFPIIEEKDGIVFGDPLPQFYSMGKKAKLSFAPDPDTGKGVVAIPGAAAQGMPRLTNWDILRTSLYQSGLPAGIFTNDVSVLDGVWVHMKNEKPPEERKTFGAKTGEAEEEQRENLVSVVTEILDGGAPWDGGGGLPEDAETLAAAASAPAPQKAAPAARAPRAATPAARAAAPAARATAPAAKAPARPVAVARKAAAAPEPEPEEGDPQAVLDAAMNAIGSVLGANKDGLKKLMLRTQVFKELADDPDMQQAVMEAHFADDAALGNIVEQYGFKISGKNGIDIVPA